MRKSKDSEERQKYYEIRSYKMCSFLIWFTLRKLQLKQHSVPYLSHGWKLWLKHTENLATASETKIWHAIESQLLHFTVWAMATCFCSLKEFCLRLVISASSREHIFIFSDSIFTFVLNRIEHLMAMGTKSGGHGTRSSIFRRD